MKAKDVRRIFIDYFKDKQHTFVAASPVVPATDPTLLFTNAGMNQFKDIFLGTGTRSYTRAVNSQPCIRVSGKHNDLEEVGQDTYHHTLFEMLGNWSFGDYYKCNAIVWAWELLTGVYKIPKNILYATVHHTDTEAAQLWSELTDIGKDRILPFGDKDNFWEMGDTGPCGPCSEIHIDRGEGFCDKTHVPGHICAVNAGCARYIELWNLVFIQYNRDASGTLNELPSKHVDTGAGLERLVSVLADVRSNYDIDIFQDIIAHIERISGVKYSLEAGVPHRVIADHIRTLAFAITDGVVPSNEGRGYVIRRLLRRAARYGQKINLKTPFLYQLVSTVVQIMGDAFPSIKGKSDYVSRVIKAEEETFFATLDKGVELFNHLIIKLQKEHKMMIPGAEVFKLYDTYGFPPDLTRLMAREINMDIDEPGFEAHMEQQKARARAASGFSQIDTEAGPKPIGGEAIIATNETDKLNMARHHTGTHLLQAALRQVLGDHVAQAGSLVSPDKLRFDFNHFEALTPEQIALVEQIVNEKIMSCISINKFEESYDNAISRGALAFFGEKYGENVRVVQVEDFSIELCGGTHLDNTGQIGMFKIVTESAIAAGVRRIEAVAGPAAHRYIQEKIEITDELSKVLKIADSRLVSKVTEIMDKSRQQDKLIEKMNSAIAANSIPALIDKAENIAGFRFVVEEFNDVDTKILLNMSDEIINRLTPGIVFLASRGDEKVTFIAKATKELTQKNISCDALVKEAASICEGSGGGSPLKAQAGGKKPQNTAQALARVKQIISEKL